MHPALQRWKDIGLNLLTPSIVLSLLACIGIGAAAILIDDEKINAVFTIAFGLVASIAGGMIANTIQRIEGHTAIIGRGIMAIRSLKTVLKRLLEIDSRFRERLFHLSAATTSPAMETSFEGLRDLVRTLRDDTINSIENWADIIPQRDIRQEIAALTDKQDQMDALQTRLLEAERESGTQGATIQELTREIQTLRKEVAEQRRIVYRGTLSTVAPSVMPSGVLPHAAGIPSLYRSKASNLEIGSELSFNPEIVRTRCA